jgi:hypothetical protein
LKNRAPGGQPSSFNFSSTTSRALCSSRVMFGARVHGSEREDKTEFPLIMRLCAYHAILGWTRDQRVLVSQCVSAPKRKSGVNPQTHIRPVHDGLFTLGARAAHIFE